MGVIKVLHVTPAYEPAQVYGGPIRSIHNLCRGLVGLGVEVDVLTTDANGKSVLDVPTDRFVDRDGVKVMYCRANVLGPSIISFSQRRNIRDLIGRYDLVHIQSVFTFNTLWAARGARAKAVPYMISPRGSLVTDLVAHRGELRKKVWLGLFDRKNLARAAAVHLTTERERVAMREMGIAAMREEVIPNGIEFPEVDPEESGGSGGVEFRRKWGLVESDRLVLFLGRMAWVKGLDLLITAFGKVLASFPEARLILAGPDTEGYLAKLMTMACSAGISKRIVATGHLDGTAKWRALKDCELLVLPSYSENFGLAALEGAAAGRPVVVTREVGVAPAIREAAAGMVTEVTSESVAGAIVGLMSNRDEAVRMGERGRRLVRERYRWPAVARRMLDLYQDILRAPSPA